MNVPVARVAEREKSAFSKRKIEAILVAAREIFTEQGFSATSMDKVAALAGVGKATVYAHFASKEALFEAVIAMEGREHTFALTAPGDEAFEVRLLRIALEAFDLLLSPTSIATYRMVAAESARSPQLGKMFFDTGPVVINRLLAEFLGEAMERNEIRKSDTHLAATSLLNLIVSDLQVRLLLGVEVKLTPTLKAHVVGEGVRVFLEGYRAERS